MTWTKTTLSEVSDIQTGPFGSQLHAADYVNSGIPTIMPQDIVGNRVITDTIACIREEDAIRLAKQYPEAKVIATHQSAAYNPKADLEATGILSAEEGATYSI